jgi:hypothetical protein
MGDRQFEMLIRNRSAGEILLLRAAQRAGLAADEHITEEWREW